MKRKIRIPLAVIIVAAIILFIAVFTVIRSTVHIYGSEYEIPPRCDSEGGHYKKCVICGKTEQISSIEPLGHNAVWTTLKEPTPAATGVRELRCTVCKKQLELVKIPAKSSPIPAMRLEGSGRGMTATNSVPIRYIYINGAEDSEIPAPKTIGSANIRLMNNNSHSYGKFSYVMNGFSVTEGEKLVFGNLGASSEISLYANNDDPTFSRRIVTFGQWKDIISENYKDYASLISMPNNADFVGYNTLLYIKSTKNDYSFAGIYTLALPYENFAANNDGTDIKYVIRRMANAENPDGYFKYVYGNMSEEEQAIKALQALLSSDAGNMGVKADTDFLIDYYSFSVLTGNADAFSDIYWVTSDGKEWYPIPASFEHSYGSVLGKPELSPYDSEYGGFDNIWISLSEKYAEKINRRMYEFATGRLSPENIQREFESNISLLDEEIYIENSRTYGKTYLAPADETDKLIDWYKKRIETLVPSVR